MFGGGLTMGGGLALLGLAGVAPAALSPAAWAWALGLTLAFLSGNLALQYGAARLPAQVTALIMLAEVVFATGSAVLLGAADPTPRWPPSSASRCPSCFSTRCRWATN